MEKKNHNIRFNMENEEARKAWECLHSQEVEEDFKSLNAFVICAINDYYERHLQRKEDSYFETREKEDAPDTPFNISLIGSYGSSFNVI